MPRARGSSKDFMGAVTYRGDKVRLPPGSVAAGRDDGGRLLYKNKARDEWYAVVKVPGGWTVFSYRGCGCGK